ncbi:MAG: SDR family oxidoreductase [Oscillospiraceae bacterium]|jgi:3-oxoacyl-[acyl-carrier protein] reductase|nr:SDR family oxidoreductase [Oscillospiraceae bacterium]
MQGFDKTALVTGAARGIGAAVAEALAGQGYFVAINYKTSGAEAEALAHRLGGVALRADVSSENEAERMLRELEAYTRGRPLEALVCNAGIALTGLFQDTAPRWRELFDVNFGGAVSCVNAALPYMLREKRGRIVFISSVWGSVGASCEAIYSASKAALHGLAKSLAKELGPSGITVNCVAPGVIDTAMNAALTPSELDELRDITPLSRLGAPRDVAAAAAFLCSDAAGFITGQILGTDGGFTG